MQAIVRVLLAASLGAAPAEFVETQGITSPLHQANLGKVTFTTSPGPLEEAKASDALDTFTLCEHCELDVRVWMSTSLVNQQHALAPKLTADELTQKGNHQVTFLVDGKQVYVEQLSPGAGSPTFKRATTAFRVPLLSTTNEDSWGRFLFARFLYRGGGEDALGEGAHTLTVEFRPYVDDGSGLKVGPVSATGTLQLAVVKPKVTDEQVAVQPIAPQSGFALADASLDASKLRELNRQILQRSLKDITSLVVLHRGKLVLEEYFNGANRQTLHDTRSVGKSFTGALLGLAVRDHKVASADVALSALYDLKRYRNFSAQKGENTLRDLLTMTSTFDGDDADDASPGNEENMYPTEDWAKFVLDLPLKAGKRRGKDWAYFTGGAALIGDLVHHAVPGGLEAYAQRELFKPLGIAPYEWPYTPKKVPNTAGGLKLRALDYAKFGQLYLDGGTFNGKRILPKAWVDASLSAQVERGDGGRYGYFFWTSRYTVDGASWDAVNASGNGGNKIFMFRDQQLVVVVTATAYNQPYAHRQVDRLMQTLLLPALSNLAK